MKRILASLVLILTLSFVHVNNVIAATSGWIKTDYGWKYSDGYNYYTGWHQINGNWYYFNEDKYMVYDTWVDNYYVNHDGAWVESATDTNVVYFADKNLELAVRDKIGKSSGDIYKSDVESITSLVIRDADIKTLNGLENFINLKGFAITDTANSLNDISALVYMPNLEGVTLRSMNLKPDQVINTLKVLKLKHIGLYGNNFTEADKQRLADAVPSAFTDYLTIH